MLIWLFTELGLPFVGGVIVVGLTGGIAPDSILATWWSRLSDRWAQRSKKSREKKIERLCLTLMKLERQIRDPAYNTSRKLNEISRLIVAAVIFALFSLTALLFSFAQVFDSTVIRMGVAKPVASLLQQQGRVFGVFSCLMIFVSAAALLRLMSVVTSLQRYAALGPYITTLEARVAVLKEKEEPAIR